MHEVTVDSAAYADKCRLADKQVDVAVFRLNV